MITKENRNWWKTYYLDPDWRDEMQVQKKLLRAMRHEEIIKHIVVGPKRVKAPDDYQARKEFWAILKQQPGFVMPKGGFTGQLPYIYVKNEVDRRTQPGVSQDEFLSKIQEDAKY